QALRSAARCSGLHALDQFSRNTVPECKERLACSGAVVEPRAGERAVDSQTGGGNEGGSQRRQIRSGGAAPRPYIDQRRLQCGGDALQGGVGRIGARRQLRLEQVRLFQRTLPLGWNQIGGGQRPSEADGPAYRREQL